jgi:hypothetical protein
MCQKVKPIFISLRAEPVSAKRSSMNSASLSYEKFKVEISTVYAYMNSGLL